MIPAVCDLHSGQDTQLMVQSAVSHFRGVHFHMYLRMLLLTIDSDKCFTETAPNTCEYSVGPKREPSSVAKKF